MNFLGENSVFYPRHKTGDQAIRNDGGEVINNNDYLANPLGHRRRS